MNYNHLNTTHEYWENELFPHLQHNFVVSSFDDYLKRFASLPSGKWLRDMESIKLLRIPFVVDPSQFLKTYKKNCVTYCTPTKVEDGVHRIIYQISPTLHIETALWMWIEKNVLNSYLSMFACFHNDLEIKKFFASIDSMKRTGDTDSAVSSGFATGFQK